MPIAAQCPNCSAKFQVKDEHAGRRGKCPKCGEAIQLPAAKPRPADDEPDEQPRKKRVADDEDDRPKRRSRQEDDEDDRPRKKKNALPLVLGILGGALLLCGGGVAGVWFGVIKPAAEQARAKNDALEAEINQRLREQNNPAPPPPPEQKQVVTNDELADQFEKYRGKTVVVRGPAELVGGDGITKGSIILRGGAKKTQIVCNFENTGNNMPPQVGEVVEIRGVVEAVSNAAQVRLKDCELLNGKPYVPPPALSVEELLKDPAKHDGKVVVVTGKVGEVVDLVNPPLINLTGSGENVLTCSPTPKGWGKLPQAGDTITLRGRVRPVDKLDGGKGCSLEQCEVVPAK